MGSARLTINPGKIDHDRLVLWFGMVSSLCEICGNEINLHSWVILDLDGIVEECGGLKDLESKR